MARSLRSRWIVASVLWTAGMLMLMHILSMAVIHVMPRFRGDRPGWPVAIGVALMCAGLLVAMRSLAPFRGIRARLLAIRRGEASRVEGQYPSEVAPLVEDLNGLLAERERAVQRARDTAGDLAHGLKTPLALLARESDAARAGGQPALADAIEQQVARMSSLIDYQLARARANASANAGAAHCEIAPCVDALVRTLDKIHAARGIAISTSIPPGATARVPLEDFEEILGNLLDNAYKWTRSKAVVEVLDQAPDSILIHVDDDGPGLSPQERISALKRGVRLDEAAPGSGLGLAIARDLAGMYQGSLTLHESPMGGLRASVQLPGKLPPRG